MLLVVGTPGAKKRQMQKCWYVKRENPWQNNTTAESTDWNYFHEPAYSSKKMEWIVQ